LWFQLLREDFLWRIGYYLYETFILNVAALAEAPFNNGQAVVGTIGAIPLYSTLKKVLKQYRVLFVD